MERTTVWSNWSRTVGDEEVPGCPDYAEIAVLYLAGDQRGWDAYQV